MTLRKILPPILLVLISFICVHGQSQSQYDKGTPPQLTAGVSSLGSYMSTELGTVNLSNGGLNFNIPLGTVGGRGNVQLPLVLSYSSKVWSASMDVDTEREFGTEQSVAYADYDNQSSFAGASAPGWTLRAGVYMSVRFVKIKRIMSGPSVGCYAYGLHKLTLNFPDKGEIEFRDDATDGAPLSLNCNTQQTASRGTRWHATDGSGAIFINDVDNGVGLFPSPNLSGTLIFADGTRMSSTTSGTIVDRNGNKITGTLTGWTDQLGRNVTIQTGATDPADPNVTLAVLITIPGYQGAPRYYKIKTGIMNQHYRADVTPTLPVITGDWDPEAWGYNWGTATRLFDRSYGLYAQQIDDREVLTEVVLPDGRSLKFKYNEFGEVAEVELPTGAKIQYDYAYRSTLPSGNSPSWETITSGIGNGITSDVKRVDRGVIAKRTYPDGINLEGTWSFGYGTHVVSSVTYPATTVTVNSNTSVLLSKQRHIFLQAGRYTEPPCCGSSVHDGTYYTLWSTGIEWRTESLDAANDVLAAAEQDWSQRAPVSWSSYPQEQPANDNRVNQSRRYFETGLMAKVETVYDQYNNPTEVKEYDFNQTLKRRTVTTYLSTNNGVNYQTNDSIHLLRLPETQTVYDGSGTQVARTTTEYDVYTNDGNRSALTSYASVSQHDSTNYGTSKTIRGNPTRIGTWLNTTGSYIYVYPRYDIVGNVVSTKDARGNVTTISFADDFGDGSNPGAPSQNPATPTYALPTLITSPPPVPGAPAHIARSQYDYSTGLLTGFRDRNNVVTQTIYNDPFNRPTQVNSVLGVSGIQSHAFMYYAPATTPFGITLAKNDVLTASDQSALDDKNLRSWTVTDGFGRTKENWTRDPQGDIKVVTNYDALGRAKQVSNPFRPSLGETAVYSESTYDLLGRVTAVTAPDSSVVSTSYSANTVTVTDQAQKKRKSVTDALGRLIEVYEDPNGWNYLTSYQYDTLDNLTGVTQGTQTRSFVYNSLKQLLSATNPESGTITYQYDDAANLLVKTDARGVSAHYAYDAFNRVTRCWYNGSSSVSATTHNSPALPGGIGTSNEAKFFYDAQSLPAGAPSFTRGASNGRLVAATYGTGSSAGDYHGYDTAGRAVLKIQQTGGVNYQISAALSISGATTSVTYPSGRSLNYTYDVAGRAASVAGNLGDGASRNYATEILYSPFGGIAKEKFGTDTPLYNKSFYNNRGQLSEIRVGTTYTGPTDSGWERGAVINHYSSQCWGACSGTDNNGNVKQQDHWIPDSSGGVQAVFVQTYAYDSLNRLQRVVEGSWQQEFVYDRWGNRTIHQTNSWGTGINTKHFDVEPNTNRLTVPAGQSGVMSYDAAGNLTNDTYTGAGNRTYDAENKITSAWGGNNQAQLYAYDANGQRIKRTVDGVETWQVYGFGGELVAEYAANGAAATPQKEYGYRNGQLLLTASAGSGLLGHWKTDENTGTSTIDSTGNGNTGTLTSGASWTTGQSGSAVSLDGVNDYVQVGAQSKLVLTTTASFSAWIHPTGAGSDPTHGGTILVKEGEYVIARYPNGTIRWGFANINPGWAFVDTGYVAPLNQWTHIAITYDNGTIKTYANGSLVHTYSGSGSIGDAITGQNDFRIGGRQVITQHFQGRIDEVRVYNRALSATEVSALACGPASAVLAVNWLVADHLGTPRMIIDQTGTLANVKRHDYLPFGEELYAGVGGRSIALGYSGGDGVRQQFTLKERDIETGLDYFLARYYGSALGRFLSVDPLGGRTEDPQTLNRYVYTRNNPLKYVDSDGLDFWIKGQGDYCKSNGKCDKDGYVTDEKGNRVTVTNNQIRNRADSLCPSCETGSYTAKVNGAGVQITNREGQTFSGVFTENAVTLLGDYKLKDFTFNITASSLKHGVFASGTFTYYGTSEETRQILSERGAFSYATDPLNKGHGDTTQFRFAKTPKLLLGITNNIDAIRLQTSNFGPSSHLSVAKRPKSNVPKTTGEWHVDSGTGLSHLRCVALGAGCQ